MKDKKKIYEKAIEAIKMYKLLYIEEVITYLPISKKTFYDFYPIESNELNTIKELIDENKVNLKVNLRQKWYKSENATLQMGIYKLLANEDELDRLSGREKVNNILEIPKMEINVFKEEAK